LPLNIVESRMRSGIEATPPAPYNRRRPLKTAGIVARLAHLRRKNGLPLTVFYALPTPAATKPAPPDPRTDRSGSRSRSEPPATRPAAARLTMRGTCLPAVSARDTVATQAKAGEHQRP